jgi:hypothetical protein
MIDFVYDPIVGLKFYFFGIEYNPIQPQISVIPIPMKTTKTIRQVELQRRILNPNKRNKV